MAAVLVPGRLMSAAYSVTGSGVAVASNVGRAESKAGWSAGPARFSSGYPDLLCRVCELDLRYSMIR